MADSIALASQRADSAGPYSANGENSPHPAGPWMSAPSRTVIPRNLVRIGMANARSVPEQLRQVSSWRAGRTAAARVRSGRKRLRGKQNFLHQNGGG